MEISTALVHKSLAAAIIANVDACAVVYDNPNQQGTKLPCWFIVHREPVSIIRENQRRAWLVYAIDLYYMRELNTPRLFDEYAEKGDALDCALTYLPIYGANEAVWHVFDRSWELAMNCLKYSLTLRIRCAPSIVEPPKMAVIEDLDVFLKSNPPIVSVRFADPEHLVSDMPQTIYAHSGEYVTLPDIECVFDVDGYTYVPTEWSIGGFGESVRVNSSEFAELRYNITPPQDDGTEI